MLFLFYVKIFFIFSLGLCLGSFLNVLVDRRKKEKSLLGFSECDFCKHKLFWWENIPVLSFLFLKGKCLKCRKKLSWQYPTVELSVGLLFLAVAFWSGFFEAGFQANTFPSNSGFVYFGIIDWLVMIFWLISSFLLAVVFLWDLKYMEIPNGIVFGGVCLAIIFSVFQIFVMNEYYEAWWKNPFFFGLFGASAVSLFFYLMYFFSGGKWIGGGDVKLGFWLGWLVGLPMVYPLLLVSYVLGAIVSLGLIFFGKKKMSSKVPFGPFLIVGYFLILFFGKNMIELWKSILAY